MSDPKPHVSLSVKIYSTSLPLAMSLLLAGVFRVTHWHTVARRDVSLMLHLFGMGTWRRYRLVEPCAQAGQDKDSNIRDELVMSRSPNHS